MLQVLKKDSMVAHENCKCTCTFCALGGCKCVFETDMDMYWFMRHVLCAPDKLHSQTSRNLFPPRYTCTCFHCLWFIPCANNPFPCAILYSCLEGRCSSDNSCFFERASTIFQCPKSRLFSEHDIITSEQCVNEDVMASSYASDPLLHARDSVPIHGIPLLLEHLP